MNSGVHSTCFVVTGVAQFVTVTTSFEVCNWQVAIVATIVLHSSFYMYIKNIYIEANNIDIPS